MTDAQTRPLLVGTRASPLALWQARDFLARLRHHSPDGQFEEHAIRTTGDAVQDRPLADIGGKGLFAKEIHEALSAGRVDFAVHSLKDLETELPPGIVLACTLPREDCRDALILAAVPASQDDKPYAALPEGALIGSSSVRRQAQMLHARPDLRFALLRGNVQRRLDRVRQGDFAASVLAMAGLRRLGMEHEAGIVLEPSVMLPSACQGIVGVTVRTADAGLRQMLAEIEDADAHSIATAERALLAALDGSCHTPIAGLDHILPDNTLHLEGLVARADGSFLLRRSSAGPRADAARIGRELGAELRADSPRDIFA